MAGKSPIMADEEQRQELMALSHSRDRGEADRARAILLTLSGWTSGEIARGYGSVLAQRLPEGRDRSLEEIGRAGASSGQSRAGVGRSRGGPVWACGGPPQLDTAASGG